MMKLGLVSFCLAALALAACTQASTDLTKASADKPAAVQTAPTTPPYPGSGDHSGGGGGGGEGGGGY
jgi:hypothetical protein